MTWVPMTQSWYEAVALVMCGFLLGIAIGYRR